MKRLIDCSPVVSAEWDHDKNKPLELSNIGVGNRSPIWWKCPKGHSYKSRIDGRIHRGHGCPFCRGRHSASLAVTHRALCEQWSDKNTTLPEDFTAGSHAKVWWRGPCGHEWEAHIHNRSKQKKHDDCPYCSNKLTDSTNSLSTLFSEIAAEWHPSKNLSTPDDVNAFTWKKAWWLGSCGHEWYSSVHTRTRRRSAGCPRCMESKGEMAIKRFLENNGISYVAQFRHPTCRSKKPLPFDFMVEQDHKKHCIEYQGIQHYEPVDFGGNSKKLFEVISEHDRIKKQWCEDNGFTLIVVPYIDFGNIEQILTPYFNDKST